MNRNFLKYLTLIITLSLFTSLLFGADKQVIIVKLKSSNGKLSSNIAQAIKDAEGNDNVTAIILSIDAKSGNLSDFNRYQKILSKSTVPIYAYINRHALGASAGLAFSCKAIYMHPEAVIGAISFSDEKELKASDVSIISVSLREQARKNGYNPGIVISMFDKNAEDLRINKKLINQKGQILSLSSTEAKQRIANKPLLSSGEFKDLKSLLSELKLTNVNKFEIDSGKKDSKMLSPMPELSGKDDKYVVLKLRQEFSSALLYSFRKAFQVVEDDESIKAIFIDMHTPGGYVNVMLEIMGLMNECRVPVYIFINTEATSAGALVTFASDGVYMKDLSVIGAAAPVNSDGSDINEDMKKKVLAFIEAKLRANANNNGFRFEVAKAMIDSDYEYEIDGKMICKKGELLMLTGTEATEIMPDGQQLHAHAIVKNLDELIALKGMENAEEIEIKLTGKEHVAHFLIFLSPFLLMIAMGCLFAEMQTPGFGVFGGIAIVAFSCFVFAQYVGGTAASWEIMIIFLGFILLLIEIFIIPGFGVCGISGLSLMVLGIILMMIPHMPSLPDMPEFDGMDFFDYHIKDLAIQLIATSILTVVLVFIIKRVFPHTTMYSKLVLAHAATKEAGYSATDEAKNISLVGLSGLCETDLRPSGIAIINNRRIDVVSQGKYIKKGMQIKVKKVEGVRVIVIRDVNSENHTDDETELE